MTSSFEKYKLLLWKNYKIQSRHYVQALFEALFPILFTIFLSYLRGLPMVYEQSATKYEEFVPGCVGENGTMRTFNNFSRVIAFSPSNNTHLRNFVNHVQLHFHLKKNDFDLIELENAEKLEEFLEATNPLVGIEFSDDLKDSQELPKKLEYALRFQELEYSYSFATERVLVTNKFTKTPRSNDKDGGPPYYNERCFLAIQNRIDKSFIKFAAKNYSIPRKTVMKKFPYPRYNDDKAIQYQDILFPVFIVLSLIYTVKNMIKNVGLEKDNQLKELMRIVGLSRYLQWAAWFTKCFIFLFIVISIMTIIMCVPIFTENGYTIFHYSNILLIWIFLIVYTLPTIAFCFFMSTLFKKASTSASTGYTIWTFLLLPFFLVREQAFQLSYLIKFLLCLMPNTGIAFGVGLIVKLEVLEVGLQFRNLFCRENEMHFAVADVLLCFIISAALFMLLTLYLEQVFPGKYGVPKPWHFPLQYCMGIEDKDNKCGIAEETHKFLDNYEDEPKDKQYGIQIKGLTKSFDGRKNVVDNLSLNIYKDQITVLLGHNGAGKTTTMSMLTGLFPPSSGTAIINGKDLKYYLEEIREDLGLCPQFDVLFDDLTVEEHLIFYSFLKGIPNYLVFDEASKYIELLGLEAKRDALSRTLSGGMKRKLSVAIALCGNSKIVIMDEPTSGMDPTARRRMWDILIDEKFGRTILLTTHFMDEADILGDRIAVMADGDLKTVGSSFFLKKRFGVGYRLVIVKDEFCSPNQVTELLKKFIPDINVETDVGTELTYVLSESYVHFFQEIFREIEENSGNLGISSYGVSLTTMEEVFLRIGTDSNTLQKHENDDLMSGFEDNVNNSLTELKPSESLSGSSLIISQVIAMVKKRLAYIRWDYKAMLFYIVFSIVYAVLLLYDIKEKESSSDHQPLKMTLKSYDSPMAILQVDDPKSCMNRCSIYRNLVRLENREGSGIDYLSTENDMDDFILNKYNESFVKTYNKFVVGATFTKITADAIAWFNDEMYHSAPLSLNLLNRVLLKYSAGKEYDIVVTNKPFTFKESDDSEDLEMYRRMHSSIEDFIILIILVVVYSTWLAAFVAFYIKEKSTKCKLLQMICGVNKFIFWLVPFLIDLILFLLITLLIILIIYCFNVTNSNEFWEMGRLFVIGASFCFAGLTWTYLVSQLFEKPATGQTVVSLLGLLAGLVLYFFYMGFSNFQSETVESAVSIIYWIFVPLPHFTLSDTLTAVMFMNIEGGKLDKICKLMEFKDCSADFICESEPDQCEDYYKHKNVIVRNVIIMLLLGIFYFILLLLKEFNVFTAIIYKFQHKTQLPLLDEELDSDVQEEVAKVNSLSQEEMGNYNLVLINLSKYYGKFLAVKRLCAVVNPSTCFGLLGANGAGKTTTFKMLTGDIPISAGSAFVKNFSVKGQLNKIHSIVGYCPQYDALLEELTGRQILKIFALIKGIPRSLISENVKSLAERLNFQKYLDKQVKAYSGGNKRKLSTALSLIGDPQVIFLDEPTTGMDPGAKRQVWNVIIDARSQGKSIILTSHSMEECEALCTKVAIMVDGQFKCLGSTQHLKNKFSSGFTLTVKVGKDASTLDHLLEVKEFVNKNFPEADLKEEYLDILTYQIPRTSLKWSEMFKVMEEARDELNIDDYSLGQTSLEQVFLRFTKTTLYSKKDD